MKQDTVAFRIESEVACWLRRASKKKRVTISHLARELVYAAFEKRHTGKPA